MGMGGCCCSLAGTVACKNCPNHAGFYGYPEPFYPTCPPPFPVPDKKNIITEKFDKDGNLVERVTLRYV